MTATQDWFTDHLGPVEIITFTLPQATDPAPWHTLHAAVDAGTIGILDLEFLRRNSAEEIEFLDLSELPKAPEGLADFDGAGSGLLDDEDAAMILAELNDGEVAVALIVEHLGLLGALRDFETAGSRLVLDGTLGLSELSDALDEAEANDPKDGTE